MTESEWLSATDPGATLDFLKSRGKASDRKLWLFACGYCRQQVDLEEEPACLRAVEVAERHAEQEACDEELERAWEALADFYSGPFKGPGLWGQRLQRLVFHTTAPIPLRSGMTTSPAWEAAWAVVRFILQDDESPSRPADAVSLLRCIFGNPFRPPSLPPPVLAWADSVVVNLATGIYQDRHFSQERMGVLADALEEAGLTDGGVLVHLRGPGPHACGCHAVDLILGKS